MAPIFASPDIAAIVAAFPPPVPAKGHATLLRSTSGERLLHSNVVLARLQKILKLNSERLEVSQLSSLLGIKDASGLLESAETTFFYSRDGSKLISVFEQRRLLDELEVETLSSFVDLDEWSGRRDVEQGLLDHSTETSKVLLVHTASDGKRFAYQQSHFETCQRDLGDLVKKTRPEKSYVNEALPRTSPNLHLWIASATIAAQGLEASANMDIHHINVTPYEYEAYQANLRSMQAEDEKLRLIKTLDDYGSVEVRHDALAGAVARQWEVAHPGETLSKWKLPESERVLADRMHSESVRRLLLDLSKEALRTVWEKSELDTLPRFTTDDVSLLLSRKTDGDLSPNDRIGMRVRRLANSVLRYDQTLDMFSAECKQYFESLKAVEDANWRSVLSDRIWFPFDLYRDSISFLADNTVGVRPDNGQAVILAVDQEFLRPAIQFANRCSLLRKTSRQTSFKPFLSYATRSTTPTASDVNNSMLPLLRQYRINEKDAPRKRAVKFTILALKVTAINNAKDVTWVMQNVIWILFSQIAQMRGQDVLFASAGKDTTKMLRLYLQLVEKIGGDEQTKEDGRRKHRIVDEFKQKVVSKIVGQGDLTGMKILAESVVTEMKRAAEPQPAVTAGTVKMANGEAMAGTRNQASPIDSP